MINCELFSHGYSDTPPLPLVAPIFTHSVTFVFGPKSVFKNKCRPRARFGLQNESRLHPWPGLLLEQIWIRLFLELFGRLRLFQLKPEGKIVSFLKSSSKSDPIIMRCSLF